MKQSPFQPSLFIQARKTTGIPYLIQNRLPKALSVCTSCDWDSDAVSLAVHKSTAYLIVISPGSCDAAHLKSARDLIREKKDDCIVFISNKRENNSELSLVEIKEIIKFIGVRQEHTYTELNRCVSKLREFMQ